MWFHRTPGLQQPLPLTLERSLSSLKTSARARRLFPKRRPHCMPQLARRPYPAGGRRRKLSALPFNTLKPQTHCVLAARRTSRSFLRRPPCSRPYSLRVRPRQHWPPTGY